MGKLKAYVMDIEEQVFEWYLDGVAESVALSLGVKEYGTMAESIVQNIYKYGEDYYDEWRILK